VLGFGAGWVAFERPDLLPGGLDADDVENELLRDERAAGRNADGATCTARQASENQFDCTVIYARGNGGLGVQFTATVQGDAVNFEREG
jgi:hypothetical protein